jgi:uncharacterized protein (DUF1330 family)
MPAYVIADVEVSDPAKYEGYKALSPGAIAAAGGKFIVRGGESDVLEGDWRPARVIVAEFPDFAAAKAFYDSALYVKARATRAGATRKFNMIVVQGV